MSFVIVNLSEWEILLFKFEDQQESDVEHANLSLEIQIFWHAYRFVIAMVGIAYCTYEANLSAVTRHALQN